MSKDKKYLFLIGDGMADLPIESLGGKTPLEYADTPNMDLLASKGILGLARTVPAGMQPGSDTANLSIFGYDPAKYYTGRAPLEAVSMGIPMKSGDMAFRCNIVEIEKGVMKDFSGGHIESDFSKIVISELSNNLKIKGIEFHPGVSYRNIMIWRDYPCGMVSETTPPHDITDREVAPYLPGGECSDMLNDIMERSKNIISQSEKIRDAAGKYKGYPTSVWLWGGGKKPAMEPMRDRFGLSGYTISAVDLINGIGLAAGLEPMKVDGATGYLDTNYEGKADAAISCLEKSNFVFLHVESPDESGHEGNMDHKLRAIEDFDKRVVGNIMKKISRFDNYAILIMPDHPTPLSLKTHTADPVPFCIYDSRDEITSPAGRGASAFSESSAAATGLMVEKAHRLIDLIINKKIS